MVSNLLKFLIVLPFVVAILMLIIKNNAVRNVIVQAASALIGISSVGLIIAHLDPITYFDVKAEWINTAMLIVEGIISLYIFYLGIRYKKYLILPIIVLISIIMFGFEFKYGHSITAQHNLFIDKFSIIMALIVGIVGGLICIYAVGYMQFFHENYHKEIKDNRKFFFFVLFLFLSAMFGLIFSNNLLWVYFFWEITTLCSFWLIRYKQNKESVNNAFYAILMNLIGGLAFAIGIVYLYVHTGVIELDKMLALGKAGALIPAILISFAGLTKSAQMPFSKWLLGAMVAPTPVSALLHSSTMVKAGVYIVIKLAPILQGTVAGFLIALIGTVTFVVTSFIAVSQSDAKKILAYSTIANLGLIIVCAGIGTYESVWAGILLVIFHAIAKCLLFLCLGIVEHKIGSRDVEDMDGLVLSMPTITVIMLIGMAGMFLSPFGMLIGKWAALKALVDTSPLLACAIAFGSAATLFFWVKWMGKILAVINPLPILVEDVAQSEWFALFVLAFFTIVICAFFPIVSSHLIEPYTANIYGHIATMGHGNIIIMSIMLTMVLLFPLTFLRYGKNVKLVDAYLGGTNTYNMISFQGSIEERALSLKNYYLEKFFGEKELFLIGAMVSIILILIMFGVSFL